MNRSDSLALILIASVFLSTAVGYLTEAPYGWMCFAICLFLLPVADLVLEFLRKNV